jgi:hypothetical protein
MLCTFEPGGHPFTERPSAARGASKRASVKRFFEEWEQVVFPEPVVDAGAGASVDAAAMTADAPAAAAVQVL